MTVTINGTTGITNDGGYTGDGVVFADTTPANTLVTTTGGNVGIGTVPGVKLDVKPADLGTTTGNTSYAYRATISSVGNTDQFDVLWYRTANASGWSNADLILQRNVDGTGGQSKIVFGGGNYTSFWTNGAERARIDSSGNLLVGTTSSGGARTRIVGSSTEDNTGAFSVLNSNTTAAACVASFVTGTNSTATSNVLVRFGMDSYNQGSGQINANGANAAAFGSFSDARLKENIVDLPSQLENICALRPVEFDYIESEGGGHQLGFIAQDMQEVYPDAVGERGDGMLTVTGWDKTTARLVKAIQEQQAIILAQESALNALTARVAALEGK